MKLRGPWGRKEIDDFLESTRVPLRLAANGASGHPLLTPLWFVPGEGRLWCATQREAGIASALGRDPRCTFEVSLEAPPYRGVRGTAEATLREDRAEEILRALIGRYLGSEEGALARFLLGRLDREVAIEIAPREVVSWDFTERMGEAG